MTLTEFRKENTLAGLRRGDLAENPILQFETWFQQAVKAEVPEPTGLNSRSVASTARTTGFATPKSE